MTAALIDDVRAMAGATTADATDAVIAQELERARTLVVANIEWLPTQIGAGTLEYRQAAVKPWGQFVPGTAGQTNGGTLACGTLRDTLGAVFGGWTLDRDGMFNFSSPGSAGTAYVFRGYGYDVYAATAAILEDMAAQQLRQYDVTLGGDQQMRSQKPANLLAAAKLYRKKQLVRPVSVTRSDEQW